MLYQLSLLTLCTLATQAGFCNENLSFEAWEAGVINEVSIEKSNLEDLTLQDANNSELANAAIPNALRDLGDAEQRPAYRKQAAEEGISKAAELQDKLQQQDAFDEPLEIKLPQPVLFEPPQYSEPTGRILDNNMTTVERP
ncbi:hypothetical protein A3742_09865 [Oleiphilus sp. HI0071]|uniref:hypothetical protein n=1 Tax=unclassified Oleiphilus TaxID=2631174 RepID=UPI0007C3038A|nr:MULTISPECIES: hypothetical protein [unclassified Oleiphilus]KZY68123.1 hypothetical protein A3737_02030 [Oleiphilus sp. HI0065]KZY82314.1 hypothetical protein A3742_09865 [Oleiphilus sp. HI0071]KZZ01431.1 hypothetical protein A3744_11615 [Oleiphilus sp. HI0073]KZZ53614.1 hypothetical protein A3758_26980 [Oleiphilus sp. HI0118]KZZ57342.1 hypothetical protein A3760_07715 [Oleiphilus sp. HI0122]KZZ74495.1 hypothetical protein A3765_11555 [Oleiphilus sp. HI0130]